MANRCQEQGKGNNEPTNLNALICAIINNNNANVSQDNFPDFSENLDENEREIDTLVQDTTKEIHRDSFVSTDSFDKEAFLEALRAYRCLWDTNNASYKNRTMKINAWRSLSTLFKVEGV